MHLGVLVGVVTDERVAHLVVRRDLPLLLGEEARLLLGAGDHAHDPFLELLLADRLPAAARGQERGLVDEVREVGAGEAGRARGERVELDLGIDRLALRVHLEDPLAADAVGPVDDDLPVETAGAQQRRVEDVGPVRGRDQDDVVLQLEPVHLDEELVQGLLALVVPAAEAGSAMAAHSVDLVHEDDARGRLLRLLEQVAHTRGADADEHLDEVGARDREERDTRLARDRAREERLTGARRPVEQNALGDPRAERLELLRVLEELLDLLELFDSLLHPGHVLEADLRRVRRHPLGAALPEAHHLRAAALHLVHEEDPEAEEENEGQETREERPPGRRAGALGVVRDVVLLEQVRQLHGVLVARVMDRALLPVLQLEVDLALVRVDVGVLDLAAHDVPVELRERGLLAALFVPVQLRARDIDEQDDHDQREQCGTEKTVQEDASWPSVAAVTIPTSPG